MVSRQDVLPEIELENTQKMEAAVVTAEMIDVGLIFAFKQYLPEILAGLGHVIMFPFAAGASLVRAILKIREAYLEKKENKPGAIMRASVETLSALTLSAAVIGTFVAAATFDVLAPILFTAALSFKTLFHLSASLYYGVKAGFTEDREAKQRYQAKMKTNFVLTVVTAATTVASGLVFIAHKATFGVLGIIGGALGAVYAAYKGFTTKQARPVIFDVNVGPSQPSRPKSFSTTDIVENANIPVNELEIACKLSKKDLELEEKNAAEKKEALKKKKTLKDLEELLKGKAKIIVNGVTALELEHGKHGKHGKRGYGAHPAFNVLVRKLSREFQTYHWKNFYDMEHERALPETQALMEEIDCNIKEYNRLINDPENKALLDEEETKSEQEQENKRRAESQEEEEKENECRRRTGFSREGLGAYLGAGLGAG